METITYPFTLERFSRFTGLKFKGAREYFHPAVNGQVCAHDLLEHPLIPHPNPFIDELMAVGSYIAGRANNSSSPFYLVTSEVIRILKNHEQESDLSFSLSDEVLMEQIRACVDRAYCSLEKPKDNSPSVVSWICKGHQRFLERFSHLDVRRVTTELFDSIDKTCTKALEEKTLEGELRVDFSRYRATLYL